MSILYPMMGLSQLMLHDMLAPNAADMADVCSDGRVFSAASPCENRVLLQIYQITSCSGAVRRCSGSVMAQHTMCGCPSASDCSHTPSRYLQHHWLAMLHADGQNDLHTPKMLVYSMLVTWPTCLWSAARIMSSQIA